MHEVWVKAVEKMWDRAGNDPLYPHTCRERKVPVGKAYGLCTAFPSLSTTVSHSCFSLFTAVSLAVSPTFHNANKYNYKVYK